MGGPALGRIEARGRVLDLADGAGVFAQGDAADAVYAILGGPGQVRIGAVERDSRGLMVELLGPGEIFGEIGVMDGSVRTADATAGLVRLLRVGAPVFLEALATEPALGRNLCRLLAARRAVHRARVATGGAVPPGRSCGYAWDDDAQYHPHPKCVAAVRRGGL